MWCIHKNNREQPDAVTILRHFGLDFPMSVLTAFSTISTKRLDGNIVSNNWTEIVLTADVNALASNWQNDV